MPYVPPEIRLRARDRGLYRPDHEHDSCGVGFIAHLRGEPSHTVIQKALQILENLEHRGAEGSDPQTGDGAGLLIQVPHGLSARRRSGSASRCLAARASTAWAWCSCPPTTTSASRSRR